MTMFESPESAPFPFDILFNILDKLSSHGDLRTLTACSQTCSSLLFNSRRYIFSSIILGAKDDANNAMDSNTESSLSIDNFKRLIDSSPYIAGYVRRLELHLSSRTMPIYETLPQGFLEQLNRICALSVTSKSRHGYSALHRWNFLSPSTVGNSLKNMLQLPTLTHLSLRAFLEVPITIFVDCRNLKNLTLHDISFLDDSDGMNLESRYVCSHLQDLRVAGRSKNDLRALLRPRQQSSLPLIDLTSMTRFDMTILDDIDFAVAEDLIQRATGIKRLSIYKHDGTEPHEFGRLMSAVSLNTLTNLVLAFYPFSSSSTDDTGNYLNLTIEALIRIPNKQVLETLSISVHCDDEYEFFDLGDGLEKLDVALCNPAMNRLYRVEITFVFYEARELWGPDSGGTEVQLAAAHRKELLKHFKQLGRNEAVDFIFHSRKTIF